MPWPSRRWWGAAHERAADARESQQERGGDREQSPGSLDGAGPVMKRDLSATFGNLDLEQSPMVASDRQGLARALGPPERRVGQARRDPAASIGSVGGLRAEPPALRARRFG